MKGGARPRILVVDDDAVISRLLQINFRVEGFEVDSASSWEEVSRRLPSRSRTWSSSTS
jgi:DNA-binding response OmpR family regulator